VLTLDATKAPPPLHAAATYTAAALHALARDEARARRPKRLLEPQRLTWERFRGALGPVDLLDLLLEDAAVTQPIPFDAAAMFPAGPLPGDLPADLVATWLDAVADLDLAAPADDYITAQARALGLPTRLARASLHKIKPHHKVLELPGTGGQLAHYAVATQPDLYLQDVFTVATADWSDRTLAGLVAAEAGLTAGQLAIVSLGSPPSLAPLAALGPFDLVVGLDPDKGGPFEPAQLHEAHLIAPDGALQLI